MQSRNQQGVKKTVIVLAALLYVVGVVYADIMFLQIVSRAFPSGLLGTLAYLGAVIAGGSAILLPVAKTFWFSPGEQDIAGVGFYLLDLAIMGANAMLAYQLSAGGPIDPNLLLWKEWCPATPLICVAGWGLIFSLDPSHKLRHAQIGLQSIQIEQIAAAMERAAQSHQIHGIVNEAGMQSALYHAQQLSNQNIPMIAAPSPTPQPAIVTASLAQTAHMATEPRPSGLLQGLKNLFNGGQQQQVETPVPHLPPEQIAAFLQWQQAQQASPLSSPLPEEQAGQ